MIMLHHVKKLRGVKNAISSYVWSSDVHTTKIVVVWNRAFFAATMKTVVRQCTAVLRFAQPAAKDPDGIIAFVVKLSFAPLAA
mmetsp:Transcript_27765/g.51097  ORF Transcript_27765/g.51097 Transcript_27765/m.51097 type:complete len:83 (-) Transcript_27765:359-607(-)